MTVRELIELLQQEDGERVVVMSRDEEGNGFQPLVDVTTTTYRDRDIDVIDGTPAVVLWP